MHEARDGADVGLPQDSNERKEEETPAAKTVDRARRPPPKEALTKLKENKVPRRTTVQTRGSSTLSNVASSSTSMDRRVPA